MAPASLLAATVCLLVLSHSNAHVLQPNRVVKRDVPTCTGAPVSPRPSTVRCNVQGSLDNPSSISTQQSTRNACRDSCISLRKCLSFSYGPGDTCTLYKKLPSKQGFQPGETGVRFWNRACFKKTCTCPNPQQSICSNQCKSLQSDPKNCGSCGKICGSDASCNTGSCICSKGSLQDKPQCSDRSCPDFSNDDQHCGNCNIRCRTGWGCESSNCVCVPQSSMPNGGFESGTLDNWYTEDNLPQATGSIDLVNPGLDSNYAVRVVVTNNPDNQASAYEHLYHYGDFALCKNTQYTYSFWYKQSTSSIGTGHIQLFIAEQTAGDSSPLNKTIILGDGTTPDSLGNSPGVWNLFQFNFVAAGASFVAQAYTATDKGGGYSQDVMFDTFSMVPTSSSSSS